MKRPLLLWRRRHRTATVTLFPTLASVAMGTDANDTKKTEKRWDGGEGTPCVLITARHKHCAWMKNSGSLAGGRGTVTLCLPNLTGLY